jgi:hypothetical protein
MKDYYSGDDLKALYLKIIDFKKNMALEAIKFCEDNNVEYEDCLKIIFEDMYESSMKALKMQEDINKLPMDMRENIKNAIKRNNQKKRDDLMK